MNAQEIFEMLNKECKPDSTPMPTKIWNEDKINFEILGFLMMVISRAFTEMRETNGKSNWRVECSFLRDKERGKSRMTKNKIREAIVMALSKNYIKDINEEDNKIFLTINVEELFQ